VKLWRAAEPKKCSNGERAKSPEIARVSRLRFAEDRIFDSGMSRQSAKRVKCGNFARTKKPEKAHSSKKRYRIRGSAFLNRQTEQSETLRHMMT
jgi:hypothetical protein